MQKLFGALALGVVLCTGSTVSVQSEAQEQHERRGPLTPEQELANLTKDLQLSSEQQAKLKPVLEDRRAQLMRLHEDRSLSREQKSEHMKQIDEGANAKVLGLLNSEQKTKYQTMIEQRRERREAMQGGRHDAGSSRQ